MLGTIIFVAANLLPTIHFIEFSAYLEEQGYEVQIYATGQALEKCREYRLNAFDFNPQGISLADENAPPCRALARQLATQFHFARTVITEVGADFMGLLHRELEALKGSPTHLAYYENPENFVPGGYSKSAAKAMQAASGVLFANIHLASEPLYESLESPSIVLDPAKRIGIGYYPLAQVQILRSLREKDHDSKKKDFLEQLQSCGRDSRVWVYFGANNDDYFTYAFPKFLEIIAEVQKNHDLSNEVILIQRHPGAVQKGVEVDLIRDIPTTPQSPQWVISTFPSEAALTIADVAMYYQTTMANQFAFCHLPILQVAHRPYHDLLVRNHLCAVATNGSEFIRCLSQGFQPLPQRNEEEVDALLFKSLGIDIDGWKGRLLRVLEHPLPSI